MTLEKDASHTPATPDRKAPFTPNMVPERKTERPSQPKTETIRPRINIEDQRLPGNLGWTGKLGDAVHRRWVQYDAWYNSIADQTHADYAAATAETMKTRVGMLEQRRDALEERMHDLEDKKQDIMDSDSVWNKLPFGRWFNERRVYWHALEQETLNREMKRLEGKIKTTNGSWQTALDRKTMHDRRVNTVIKTAEERLDARLRPVENHRKRIDARIIELGENTANYENIIVGLEQRVDALKTKRYDGPQTEEERQKRTAQISTLKKHLRDAKRTLNKAREKLDRAYQHQERLGRAQTLSSAAKDALITRYYRKITEPDAPAAEAEGVEDIVHDIAEDPIERGLKKVVSNEQFTKLWNDTFQGARITSFKVILDMWEKAFPSQDFLSLKKRMSPEQKEPSHTQTVEEWIQLLVELYNKSPEFQALLKSDSATRGIDDAVNKLSLSAAYSTHL